MAQRSRPLKRLTNKLAALATPERVRRYPATVAVVFFLVWIGGFLFGRQGRVLDAWGKFLGNDFVAFYTGGRFLLDGRMGELYDFGAQHDFQQSLVAPVELAQTSPFINPPYATWLYAPFAAIPDYMWALVAWFVCGVASIAASIWCVRRATPGLLARPVWHMWAIVGCAPPTLLWLGYGQASALILLVWSAVYLLVVKGRSVWGGAVLALLAIKPQLALGWALILMMRRRWGALCAGAGVLLACIGTGVWLHPEAMGAWWGMRGALVELLREPTYPSWGVCSIYGFFNLLVYPFSKSLANLLTIVCSAGVLGGLVKLWWRKGAVDAPDFHARVAITLMCAPLLAGQFYTYDLMLGVLPVWIVVGLCHRRFDGVYLDGGPVLVWTVVLMVASFAVPPLLAAQLDAMRAADMTAWGVQPMPGLILGWSVAVYRVLTRTHQPEEEDKVVMSDEDH